MKGAIKISLKNYLDITKEYGQDTKIESYNKMRFPMIKKPADTDEFNFRFVTESQDQEFFKLDLITNDKQSDENTKAIKKRNFLGLNNISNRNGIYRIVATISNPQKFFEKSNKFFVASPTEYKTIDIPLPPEDIFASKIFYWDIGFISGKLVIVGLN